jgi:hypothetical protein
LHLQTGLFVIDPAEQLDAMKALRLLHEQGAQVVPLP